MVSGIKCRFHSKTYRGPEGRGDLECHAARVLVLLEGLCSYQKHRWVTTCTVPELLMGLTGVQSEDPPVQPERQGASEEETVFFREDRPGAGGWPGAIWKYFHRKLG